MIMASVDILLATYNGEKYIKQQIDSIINQTFKDWRLIIHDDGSTDNTLNIIKSFNDCRIEVINDKLHFGSSAYNFMYLLRFSQSPYIMFCDQDDIWFEDKVYRFYNMLLCEDSSIPVAVYSKSLLWNEKEGVLGIGGFDKFPNKLEQLICCNGGIQGCSSMFNRAALDILISFNGRVAMHDHLLNLVVLSFGKAIPINEPLMYYRQHDSNVTGRSNYTLSSWSRVKKSIRLRLPIIDTLHFNTIEDFYCQFKKRMSIDKLKIFEAYLNLPNENILKRSYKIIIYRFSRNNSVTKLLIKNLIHPIKN